MISSRESSQCSGQICSILLLIPLDISVFCILQGFYNLLLTAGLVCMLALENVEGKLFFLAAVIMAGIYGTITTNPMGGNNWAIFRLQVVPGTLGFVLEAFGYLDTDGGIAQSGALKSNVWAVSLITLAASVATIAISHSCKQILARMQREFEMGAETTAEAGDLVQPLR
jgi:hypothetical protein